MQQMLSSVSIQFLTGPEQGRSIPLNKPTNTIGREPSQNDIIPTDPTISRTHAQIIYLNGNWYIKNVSQNDNNLTANQQKILSNQQRILTDGDTVGIGQNTTFRVFIRPVSSASIPAVARSFSPVPPSPGMQPPYQAPNAPHPPQPSGAWQQQQNNKTERASQPGMTAMGTIALP